MAENDGRWEKLGNQESKTFKVSKRSAGIPSMIANMFVPKFEKLAGAVHDFTDPATGVNYMIFPTKLDLDIGE